MIVSDVLVAWLVTVVTVVVVVCAGGQQEAEVRANQ